MLSLQYDSKVNGRDTQTLYSWGCNHPDPGVRSLTNTIQVHCDGRPRKMRGLFNLVENGYSVSPGNSLFEVRIEGILFDIGRLQEYAR